MGEYTCRELNPYYSQCVPGTSPTLAPTTTPPPPLVTTTSTTSTSTPIVGECKAFCAQSVDSWAFKCSWDCCIGCAQCASTTERTTNTTSTTTTTVTAVFTTPSPGLCRMRAVGKAFVFFYKA